MPLQHVELGDRQRGHPVEAHRVAQGDQVDPAAAPLAAGRRAVLVAALEHVPPDLVVELGREGPGADPGRVGLGDAPDLVDVGGPDAGADAGGAGDRVRGGDEGIGAVVEVEQRRLGALEDHRAAAVERLPAEPRGVGDVGLEPVAEADVLLGHRVQVEAGVGRVVDRLLDRLACRPRPPPCAACAAAPRARAAPAAWARARRGSSCAGSSRRAGPGPGSRGAAPCRRSRGRCRAAWCRSRACPASPRPPCRAARGRA